MSKNQKKDLLKSLKERKLTKIQKRDGPSKSTGLKSPPYESNYKNHKI
jgi:hypothetical protein